MDLLPGEHERGALLDRLAAIIEAVGFERFVASPLLEPDPRFFPDPWEQSAGGVRALTLRLLRYAGGDRQDAVVTLDDESLGRGVHEGAVAWFAGIEAGFLRAAATGAGCASVVMAAHRPTGAKGGISYSQCA